LKNYFALPVADINFATTKASGTDSSLPKYRITTPMSASDDAKIIYASLSIGIKLNTARPELIYIQSTLREQLTTTSLISDWDGNLYLMRGDSDPKNKFEFAHITESASGADLLETPMQFIHPDGKVLIVISFADAVHSGKIKGQKTTDAGLRDFFVYDFTAPYNTGTYSLVPGSKMFPLFPVLNSTSANYLSSFVGLSSGSISIVNSTKLKLTQYHWTTAQHIHAPSNIPNIYLFQEATNELGVTTVTSLMATQADPTKLIINPIQTHFAPPLFRPSPSKAAGKSKSKVAGKSKSKVAGKSKSKAAGKSKSKVSVKSKSKASVISVRKSPS